MAESDDIQRRKLLKLLCAAAAGSAVPHPSRAATHVDAFKLVHHENIHLYFDFDRKPDSAKLFVLGNPDRLVIDLGDTAAEGLQDLSYNKGAVAGIRFGLHEQNRLRIVVDLRRTASPTFQFVPRQGGQRLVVDLGVPGDPLQAASSSHVIETTTGRDVVVAIDAGHGGKDPGAIGKRKTLEKDITLQVARRLERQLGNERGIRVKMIRSSDVYVPLRRRIEIARQAHADLFMSLHADAFPRRDARGSSVFALSLKGASSEAAQFLAEQANKSDPLEGVDMGDMTADLKRTLIELSQNTTIESSIEVGNILLGRLSKIGNIHKPKVEQANFAVLKSPDIPSVLVETAFISNPSEEKKLRNSRFQEKLAQAIRSGVVDYFHRRAPEGSWFEARSGSG